MSLEADAGAKIDKLLLKIPRKQRNKDIKKKQGGLAALMPPIKYELEYSLRIVTIVRQNAIRKLLEDEMRQYDCELRERGICFSPANG